MLICCYCLHEKAEASEGVGGMIDSVSTWLTGKTNKKAPYPESLTKSEIKYIEIRKNIIQNMYALSELPGISETEIAADELDAIKINVQKDINSQASNMRSLRKCIPPDIFRTYHKYTLMMAESILVYTKENGKMFSETVKYIEENGLEATQSGFMERYEPIYDKYKNEYQAMVDTINCN